MVIEPVPRDRWPDRARLIIEVADNSRARDEEKAATYSAAGVAEYWLVDIERDEVLVHRQPTAGRYASMDRVTTGRLTPLLAVPPVDVAALLAH
jgi:Uma2 family endonuclease